MDNIEKNKGKILIVHNDDKHGSRIGEPLAQLGHSVHNVKDEESAIKMIKVDEFDLIVANMFGDLEKEKKFLGEVTQHSPETEVIIITENECYKTAVEAVKMGAYDYIKSPYEHEHLLKKIEGGLKKRFHRSELNLIKKNYAMGKYEYYGLQSRNIYMQDVINLIQKVSKTDTTVLIEGETGTGKELVARAVHENSLRKNSIFVAVNCAALTETLLESELFGHEKGAFTGAFKQKLGRFEIADKGTIFLDEICDLPLSTQVKLLRVLQEREFERVGGTEIVKCDTRIIGATNKNLKEYLTDGKFREDLYYRLNVFPIKIPPLRERKDDIPLIAYHFMEKSCKNLNQNIKDISLDALDVLIKYEWPGNIREFENVIERSVLMESKDILNTISIKPRRSRFEIKTDLGSPNYNLSFREYMRSVTADIEKVYISSMLTKYKGNIRLMASKTGLDRKTIYRKMKDYGIDIERFRSREHLVEGGADGDSKQYL